MFSHFSFPSLISSCMCISYSFIARFAQVCVAASLLFPAQVRAAVTAADYDATIQAAHHGKAISALIKLEVWHRLYPEDRRFLYDLISILSLTKQDEAAFKYFNQVVHSDSPAYVIKALAISAHRLGHEPEAEKAFKLVVRKTPDDTEAHAGLVYTWIAQSRTDEALAYVKNHLPQSASAYRKRDLPLLVAKAELHDLRKERLLAANAYQDVLVLDPDFRYAVRGQVFAINDSGIPHLAKRLSDQHSDVFAEDERYRLAHDAAARTIVFGQAQLATDESPARFSTTDVGIQQNKEEDRFSGQRPVTQFDRIVALRDRMRMQEAVDLYQSLVARKITILPYAKAAAADAYLYLEQPEVARDLYLDAIHDIASDPSADVTSWRVALAYAYSEGEQHGEAQALADQIHQTTPVLLNKGIPTVEVPNEEYAQVALLTALVRLYAGRLEQAEQRLESLRALAPNNTNIRAAWGTLQSARERPRAALEEFTLLQTDDSKSLEAAVGRAENLLALNQFDEARSVIVPLLRDYSENKSVQNLARQLDNHDRLSLQIDMTFGHGGSTAGAESLMDSRLYSSPLKNSLGEQYRVFAHVLRSEGEVNNEALARTRVGAGIDFRARDVSVEAEVNNAVNDPDSNGIALAVTWSLSDAWRVNLALDTNINDLPAAAFRNGVTGTVVSAGVTWINSESRRAGLSLSHGRFSDDNARDTTRAYWNERWISGPVFKLDSAVNLSSSTNSLSDRVYFNPTRDHQADATLSGEWLTWRRYQRAFSQRLTYTLGSYWQEGFARGVVNDLRYEHIWRGDQNVTFKYGLGHGVHPYDGNREERSYGYLNLDWQIK